MLDIQAQLRVIDAAIAYGWDLPTDRQPVRSYLCFVWGNYQCGYRLLRGEAHLLAVGVWSGAVPVGVLLDRMEEYPSEVKGRTGVAEAVEWLRRHRSVMATGFPLRW